MDISNIHYSTNCQSCGYIVEITQDIIRQEGVECDACGRHISLWELPDKTLVKKIMEIRKNELYVLWEQKKREYDEFSKVLQDLKNKLDCLNYPYEFILLRQSRKERKMTHSLAVSSWRQWHRRAWLQQRSSSQEICPPDSR